MRKDIRKQREEKRWGEGEKLRERDCFQRAVAQVRAELPAFEESSAVDASHRLRLNTQVAEICCPSRKRTDPLR